MTVDVVVAIIYPHHPYGSPSSKDMINGEMVRSYESYQAVSSLIREGRTWIEYLKEGKSRWAPINFARAVADVREYRGVRRFPVDNGENVDDMLASCSPGSTLVSTNSDNTVFITDLDVGRGLVIGAMLHPVIVRWHQVVLNRRDLHKMLTKKEYRGRALISIKEGAFDPSQVKDLFISGKLSSLAE